MKRLVVLVLISVAVCVGCQGRPYSEELSIQARYRPSSWQLQSNDVDVALEYKLVR